MVDEPLLVVAVAGQRYAVAQHDVQSLQRIDSAQAAQKLSTLLGAAADDNDAPYALAVTTTAGAPTTVLMRVHHADLRGYLPQLALPEWLARLAHPAIVGLALDGADLLPLVDLVQLAHQTGRETT